MNALQRYTNDLISLFFPELCNACDASLYRGEKEICIKCLYDLPYTDFHTFADNPAAKIFWGRQPINAVTALLYFKKGIKTQRLLHQLKYNNKTELGIVLGNLLGKKLKESAFFADIDLIVPVPLHYKKLKQRGYNQSEYIAKGIAQSYPIVINNNCIIRNIATDSQTKKARYNRFENMQDVFSIRNELLIEGKHVLLVDDVITTGATLEACASVLQNHAVKKISIATLAIAK